MKSSTKKLLSLAVISAALSVSDHAFAANPVTPQTVTASISFDTPLSITSHQDISFGTYITPAASSGKTYIIDTADAVTGTGAADFIYGTPTHGNIVVAGSATQTIDISVNGYTTVGGVAPTAATCIYNATGSEAACSLSNQAAPGAGKTLLLGVTLTASGSPTAGSTSSPTFDVNFVYH